MKKDEKEDVKPMSDAKKAYRNLINAYKKQCEANGRMAKYEQKKEELETKYKAIK